MSKLSSFLDDVDDDTTAEQAPADVIETTRTQLKRAGINPPESEPIIEEELGGRRDGMTAKAAQSKVDAIKEEETPKRRGRPAGSVNKPKSQSLQPTPSIRADRDTEAAPPPEGASDEMEPESISEHMEPLTLLRQALSRLEAAGWDVTIKLKRR